MHRGVPNDAVEEDEEEREGGGETMDAGAAAAAAAAASTGLWRSSRIRSAELIAAIE